MKKIILAFVIWFHRLQYGSTVHEPYQGKFFVECNDGKQSRPMYFDNARTYACLFGGTVIHKPSGKRIKTYITKDSGFQ